MVKITMKMFLGEYNPNITEGSRVALPKKLREQITSSEVVMTKGFDKCILVYDRDDWVEKAQKQVEKYNGAVDTSDLERYLYASAMEASVDTQGRFVVSANLLDYAGITKELAVVGVGDHIEIWNESMWKNHLSGVATRVGR